MGGADVRSVQAADPLRQRLTLRFQSIKYRLGGFKKFCVVGIQIAHARSYREVFGKWLKVPNARVWMCPEAVKASGQRVWTGFGKVIGPLSVIEVDVIIAVVGAEVADLFRARLGGSGFGVRLGERLALFVENMVEDLDPIL